MKLSVIISKGPISTEIKVVVVNIPLLLSSGSIRADRRIINSSVDGVSMLNQTIQLIFTSCGIYAVVIAKTKRDLHSIIVNVLLVNRLSRKKKKREQLRRFIYDLDIPEMK